MSEYNHLRPEWLQIPHEDVEATLSINGLMRTFSTADSAYWIFPDRYKMFNHIIKWLENGDYECWFGADQDDYDTLHEAGITQITPPYPNTETITRFWQVEMADYDRELREYEATGEIPSPQEP